MTARRIALRCLRRALVEPGRIAEAGEVVEVAPSLAVDLVNSTRFALVDPSDAAALLAERKRRLSLLPRAPEARAEAPWQRLAS